MANQYSALTRKNILIKMNRQRSPVSSAKQLADEFGYNTMYTRRSGLRQGLQDTRAPEHFRNKVVALVGERVWNQLRQDQFVNLAYR